MEYVYILRSTRFTKTYTGHTNNLSLRIKQHNKGFSTYTSKFKPWEVIYTEVSTNSNMARLREKYLKSSAGRRWIKKYIFSTIVNSCKIY